MTRGKFHGESFMIFTIFALFFESLTREINVSVNSPNLPSCKMSKNADS